MRKLILAATLAITCVALGGCMHHTTTIGSGGNTASVPVYDKWQAHYLFSLIGDEEVNVNALCPSGNATVKTNISFLNGIVGALIGLIYYPTTVKVYCGAVGAQNGTEDAGSAGVAEK